MQKIVVWSVCLFLGGGMMTLIGKDAAKTAEASPAPVPDIQLVLKLTDGSRVIGTPSTDKLKLKTKYATLEFLLSKSRTIELSGTDRAARVDLQNGDELNGALGIKEIALKTDAGPVTTPLDKVDKILVRAGSLGGDYINSLGMEFITVPGVKGLFAIWDTRVQDYRAYAETAGGVDGKWKSPGFKQGDDHPVVNVNWAEANAFCTWLTQKERKEGKIRDDQEYRLPTDKEWRTAAGPGKFPWGEQWPPQEGAGNYAAEFKTDTFANTSPVGSFKPNAYGLYDMGGNVWQWCGNWFRAGMSDAAAQAGLSWFNDDGGGKKYRVVHGASWSDRSDPVYFASSFCDRGEPERHRNNYGFRCILAPVPPSQ